MDNLSTALRRALCDMWYGMANDVMSGLDPEDAGDADSIAVEAMLDSIPMFLDGALQPEWRSVPNKNEVLLKVIIM